MNAQPILQIRVGLNFSGSQMPVGRLAMRDRRIYFEYDQEFLAGGLEISPFQLRAIPGVQTFDRQLFEGPPGVFNDSLPDGWGRLLLDRAMRAEGVLPQQLGPLDRLAHVGCSGMGALTYEPNHSKGGAGGEVDLNHLAAQSQDVLEGEASDVLMELLALNGSSAGARPKALIGFNKRTGAIIHGASEAPDIFAPWLVKFPNIQDGLDAGAVEFVYAEMVRRAGLDVMETHLFQASRGAGYFAVKRFDRKNGERLHMHTACGLLHSDFRTPALDYRDLLELTALLTRDVREVAKMFRIAVFNVLAHNRDDHSKNFSFLIDQKGDWRLAPAYDLTFLSGPGGEQSATVLGEGKAPGPGNLRALGATADLDRDEVARIIDQTEAALAEWPQLAKNTGVTAETVRTIEARINVSA